MSEINTHPVVSVCMITYNHEPYIAEAIEGVLMQQTDFPIELVIGEDCSTDRTREICLEYQRKHPELIRLLLNEKNIGMMPNFVQTLQACRGKYVALCEGDDYWTDPLKLQKQVDFLEQNPEFIGSFHDCIIYNENDKSSHLRIGERIINTQPDLASIIIQNNLATASLVFRNTLNPDFFPSWYNSVAKGDYALVVLLAEYGPFKYINAPMSVYRLHTGGVWSQLKRLQTVQHDLHFYNCLYSHFTDKTIKNIISAKRKNVYYKYAIEYIKSGNLFNSLKYLLQSYPFSSTDRELQPTWKLGAYLLNVGSYVKSIFFPNLKSVHALIRGNK